MIQVSAEPLVYYQQVQNLEQNRHHAKCYGRLAEAFRVQARHPYNHHTIGLVWWRKFI